MVIRRDAPLDLLLEARFQHYADGAVPVSDINRVLFVSLRAIFFVPKSRPMQSQLLPRYLIFAGLFLLHLVRGILVECGYNYWLVDPFFYKKLKPCAAGAI